MVGLAKLDPPYAELPLQQLPRCLENPIQHGLGELAGERILLAGVIASQERAAAGELDRAAVAKLGQTAAVPAAVANFIESRAPGNLSQGQEHSGGHKLEGRLQ